MGKLIFIILITIGCLGLVAQVSFPTKIGTTIIKPQEGDSILWSEGRKLNWDDFKSNVYPNKDYLSASTVTIDVNCYCDKGKYNWKAEALFSKSMSWVKNGKSTDYVLQHEQNHFNLTEVYARRIRKECVLYSNPCANLEKLKSIIDGLKEKYDKEQLRYDLETKHGGNKTAQKKWEEDIKKQLKELDAYKRDKNYTPPKK